jgi:hypothetical protein
MGCKSSGKVRNLLGEDGIIYKSAAGALTIPTGRRVKAIYAHAASVVVPTLSNEEAGDTPSAVNVPAGSTWIAWCSALSVTSGEITAYLDEKST